MTTPTTKRNPWSWIPTLYFAEGLPYVADRRLLFFSFVFRRRDVLWPEIIDSQGLQFTNCHIDILTRTRISPFIQL